MEDPNTKRLACACSPAAMTSHYHEDSGRCWQHFLQGPCPRGQTFRLDPSTNKPGCITWG